MQPSTLQTVSVPAAGAPTTTPIAICTAPSLPIRVLVRNRGPVLVFLGFSSGDVANQEGPSTAVYELGPGESDVFVVAPKQRLYVSASGANGRVAVAVSEALPIDLARG